MTDRKTILFLFVRALSAAVNVLSIAIFTRLAGPVDYGQYLIIFAWATILFGFATQWMKFAYFGVYRPGPKSDEFLLSFGALALGATGIVFLLVLTVALTGLIPLSISFPVFTLVLGMTFYEGAFEASRTQQDNKIMILAMLLRATLMLLLGAGALIYAESAQNLAYAIAIAHVLAAAPSLFSFRHSNLNAATWTTILKIVRYGWPLALAFGVVAAGQSVDRLLLAQLVGADKMAPYGVISDFLRQTYMVAGEGIALSLITTAKHHFNKGNQAESDRIMRQAFTACLSAAIFGALFFIFLGDEIVSVLLGPDFRQSAIAALPILAIAFAIMTMRLFYFAQIIYFTASTSIELIVALIFVLTSVTGVFLLVPAHGAVGAATALLLANLVSTLLLIAIGRRSYLLPIDRKGAVFIILLAVAAAVICYAIESVGLDKFIRFGAQAAVIGACAVILLLRFRFWGVSPITLPQH